VEYEKLSDSRLGESSAVIRQRVEKARQRQRFGEANSQSPFTITRNADMLPVEVRQFGQLDNSGPRSE
jgi:magnesium chelatase family protein